jgi:tetratricopeptide (TPR) repeat protein
MTQTLSINRGIALQELKRFEEALQSYDRAGAIVADNAGIFSNRGGALYGLKRFAEAVASFERALALNPDSADTFFQRGNALHALRLFEEAVASYDRAIALKGDYADAFKNHGVACLRPVNFPGPHGDTTRLVRNTSLCGNPPKHDAGHAG